METVHELLQTFFKITEKSQNQWENKKVYDNPKTPYQRLLESDKISDTEKEN